MRVMSSSMEVTWYLWWELHKRQAVLQVEAGGGGASIGSKKDSLVNIFQESPWTRGGS